MEDTVQLLFMVNRAPSKIISCAKCRVDAFVAFRGRDKEITRAKEKLYNALHQICLCNNKTHTKREKEKNVDVRKKVITLSSFDIDEFHRVRGSVFFTKSVIIILYILFLFFPSIILLEFFSMSYSFDAPLAKRDYTRAIGIYTHTLFCTGEQRKSAIVICYIERSCFIRERTRSILRDTTTRAREKRKEPFALCEC